MELDQGRDGIGRGKTFADENTTEEAAKEEYHKIADRRVRLGLVLSEIGEKNKITVTDDEGQPRGDRARALRCPAARRKSGTTIAATPSALAQLRAPIYEDKVVDFVLELANVTEKKVTARGAVQGRRRREDRRLIPGSLALTMNRRKRARRAVSSLWRAAANRLQRLRPASWLVSALSPEIGPYL